MSFKIVENCTKKRSEVNVVYLKEIFGKVILINFLFSIFIPVIIDYRKISIKLVVKKKRGYL